MLMQPKAKTQCGASALAIKIECEGVTEKVQAPCVRRLMKEYKLSFGKMCGSCDSARFTKVALSLAIPLSMLLQPHWDRKDFRKVGKFVSSFLEGLEFLAKLDSSADQDLDLIKFESALLFQKAVSDVNEETGHGPLPPSSSIEGLQRKQVFCGLIWREIKRRLVRARAGDQKSLRFFSSYLLSKRGWPQLSEKKRFESVEDHQKYLTKTPEEVSDSLLDQVRRSTRFVVRNIETEKLAPSQNASFAYSRKKGGAKAEVMEVLGETGLPPLKDDMSFKQVGLIMNAEKRLLWQDLRMENLGRKASDFAVRVQVIPEPGKFRIITAGPASLYTYLQPLQGSLLRNWAQCQYSTMSELWKEEVRAWHAPDDWVWNSGDYKAATDQLNQNTSLECIDEIKRLYHLHDDFVTGFEGSEVQYASKDVKRYEFGEERLPRSIWQRNGQLMGHPLSFPVLCIINLAALEAALRIGIAQAIITKGDRDVIRSMTKINGDDILFPCPKRFCRIWEETTSKVGLQLSIGKSYASEHFAMVNNVMFYMYNQSEANSGKENVQLGYLNQKLILNYSLKGGEPSESPLEIGFAMQEMMKCCPEARVFQCDVRRNRTNFPIRIVERQPDLPNGEKQFKEKRFLPNLYIDSKLGGLGIDPEYSNGPLRATPFERQIAAALAEGIFNSYFYATGVAQKKGVLEKILQRLPKATLNTTAKAGLIVSEGVDERTSWADLPFDEERLHTRATDKKGEGFKSWVAKLCDESSAVEESTRIFRLKKFVKGLRPMNGTKVFELRPHYLFPQLPKPARAGPFKYKELKLQPNLMELDE